MNIFNKDIQEVTYQDVENLLSQESIGEGYAIDFKEQIEESKIEKYVSSLANSNGGMLIFGVKEIENETTKKGYSIVGIEPKVRRSDVDEWINRKLASNIQPTIFYNDPKTLPIPDTNRVILLLEIPESNKKPHFSVPGKRYYIRINDQSEPANHYQIRDMFELTRIKNSEFEEFLAKKNLLDETEHNFGLNILSKGLYNKFTTDPKPSVLFSLIPKYPKENIIAHSILELKTWLRKSASCWCTDEKYEWLYADSPKSTYKLNGVVFRNMENKKLISYFSVETNGYVEGGLSCQLTRNFEGNNDNPAQKCFSLTPTIGYEIMLMDFARRFYKFINYNDEIQLQISFSNLQDFNLCDPYSNRWDTDGTDKNRNNYDNNFKLTTILHPNKLSDDDIIEIAKKHSLQISHAFGIDEELCFYEKPESIKSPMTFRDVINTNLFRLRMESNCL